MIYHANDCNKGFPMNVVTTAESVLSIALKAMEKTPDERLRKVVASLTRHMHEFVREVELTEAEFEFALEFLVAIGQATGEKTNEVVLAADILGVSTLVALLNNINEGGESQASLLGPFWRAMSPVCKLGDNIARDQTQGLPLKVVGCVKDKNGHPLAGATVDVWHASPVGLYENQDEKQPDMNLRGQFTTDSNGCFHFETIKPAGYPVPTNGPCGVLLRAQKRHPNRPAHLHFMVSKPGYKVLITQVFADDDENLESDPVFGVTKPLIGRFVHDANAGFARLEHDFYLELGKTVFPHPPIP